MMRPAPAWGLDKTGRGGKQRPLGTGGDVGPGGRLAQLVEQLTLNQRVVGSNPTAPTINASWCDGGPRCQIAAAAIHLAPYLFAGFPFGSSIGACPMAPGLAQTRWQLGVAIAQIARRWRARLDERIAALRPDRGALARAAQPRAPRRRRHPEGPRRPPRRSRHRPWCAPWTGWSARASSSAAPSRTTAAPRPST